MRSALSILFLLLSLTWGGVASATSVLWVDLETLGEASDLIALVEVDRAVVISRAGVLFEIYTEYQLVVQERYKGDAQRAAVRLPGGIYEGKRVLVEGIPELEVGGRYLLVLEEVPASAYGEEEGVYYVPVGLKQGVWQVDAEGNLRRELSGAAYFDATGEGQVSAATTLSLEALLAALGVEVEG